MSKQEIYNFSPGPAALPKEVVLKVKQELADYAGLGLFYFRNVASFKNVREDH